MIKLNYINLLKEIDALKEKNNKIYKQNYIMFIPLSYKTIKENEYEKKMVQYDIENVIEANLKACLSGDEASGKAYNIAYGERYTLNELYSKLVKLLDSDIKPIYGKEREGDIKHSLANIDEAKKYLKYNPKYDLNSGLELAIDWYKNYLK